MGLTHGSAWVSGSWESGLVLTPEHRRAQRDVSWELLRITRLPSALKAAANSALVSAEWSPQRNGSDSNKNRLQKEENLLSKCIWPPTLHPTPWPPSLKPSIFFERGEGFRGELGACQYQHINNLTASSAFEDSTWQLHNGLRCSRSRTRLASLSEQHRDFIKTSHSCEVLILHQSLSLTVLAQAGAPK